MILDIESYVRQLMPPNLRLPKYVGLGVVLFRPLKLVLDLAERFGREANYRAGLTGQKLLLEHYLQSTVDGGVYLLEADGALLDFVVIVPPVLTADQRRQVRELVDAAKLAGMRYAVRDAFAGGGPIDPPVALAWTAGFPRVEGRKIGMAISVSGTYLAVLRNRATNEYAQNSNVNFSANIPVFSSNLAAGQYDVRVAGLTSVLTVVDSEYSFRIASVEPIDDLVDASPWKIILGESSRGVRDFTVKWYKGAQEISSYGVGGINTSEVDYLYFNPRQESPWKILGNGAGTYRVRVFSLLNGQVYNDEATVIFTAADLGIVPPPANLAWTGGFPRVEGLRILMAISSAGRHLVQVRNRSTNQFSINQDRDFSANTAISTFDLAAGQYDVSVGSLRPLVLTVMAVAPPETLGRLVMYASMGDGFTSSRADGMVPLRKAEFDSFFGLSSGGNAFDGVDGWNVTVYWADWEPSPGVFETTKLLAMVNYIKSKGAKYSFSFRPFRFWNDPNQAVFIPANEKMIFKDGSDLVLGQPSSAMGALNGTVYRGRLAAALTALGNLLADDAAAGHFLGVQIGMGEAQEFDLPKDNNYGIYAAADVAAWRTWLASRYGATVPYSFPDGTSATTTANLNRAWAINFNDNGWGQDLHRFISYSMAGLQQACINALKSASSAIRFWAMPADLHEAQGNAVKLQGNLRELIAAADGCYTSVGGAGSGDAIRKIMAADFIRGTFGSDKAAAIEFDPWDLSLGNNADPNNVNSIDPNVLYDLGAEFYKRGGNIVFLPLWHVNYTPRVRDKLYQLRTEFIANANPALYNRASAPVLNVSLTGQGTNIFAADDVLFPTWQQAGGAATGALKSLVLNDSGYYGAVTPPPSGSGGFEIALIECEYNSHLTLELLEEDGSLWVRDVGSNDYIVDQYFINNWADPANCRQLMEPVLPNVLYCITKRGIDDSQNRWWLLNEEPSVRPRHQTSELWFVVQARQ